MPIKCAEIEIVRLTKSHPKNIYTEIASLHIEQIHHGLLPLLGCKFLSRLYYELAIAPNTGVWAALKSNELVGFISGSANVRKSYFAVLSRAWPLFLYLTWQVILKTGLLWKTISVLCYPFKHSSETQHSNKLCSNIKSEILAIAVNMDFEGQGIGRKLIQTFEKELSQWNNRGYYCVATNLSDIKSNSFYLKVGFLPCHQVKHNDLMLQVYLKNI